MADHFDDADRAFLHQQERIFALEKFYARVLADIRTLKAQYDDNGSFQYDLCRAEALLEREQQALRAPENGKKEAARAASPRQTGTEF